MIVLVVLVVLVATAAVVVLAIEVVSIGMVAVGVGIGVVIVAALLPQAAIMQLRIQDFVICISCMLTARQAQLRPGYCQGGMCDHETTPAILSLGLAPLWVEKALNCKGTTLQNLL